LGKRFRELPWFPEVDAVPGALRHRCTTLSATASLFKMVKSNTLDKERTMFVASQDKSKSPVIQKEKDQLPDKSSCPVIQKVKDLLRVRVESFRSFRELCAYQTQNKVREGKIQMNW
jgi:hypothetical protein